jgi:hypothetical protein
MRREPKIGDVLERKVIMFRDELPVTTWKKGTVLEVTERSVSLEYEDGVREVVERGCSQMRMP